MSGFSADWLALREPLDLAARNRDVETRFTETLPRGPVRLLDLASGAGSTVAALAPHLGQAVSWLLTDFDPALLAVAAQRFAETVEIRRIDLQAELEELPFEEVDAVTTSAFLDLASEAFLARLARRLAAAQKPFLASLTYDGRADFSPGHTMDDTLLAGLNRHQRTDKGFGAALGPEAAATAIALFENEGFKVVQGRSDWDITPAAADFLQEFLGGWHRVGRELGLDGRALEAWWQDRQARIRAGALSMTVGHVDFVAIPQD